MSTHVAAETIFIDYLNRMLDVPVFADVPADRPDSFVTVERTGGRAGVGVDYPTLVFQAWAPTRARAAKLAATVTVVLTHAPENDARINAVTVVSHHNWPAPHTPGGRYQITTDCCTYL